MLAFFFVFAACSASWGLFGSWHLGVVEMRAARQPGLGAALEDSVITITGGAARRAASPTSRCVCDCDVYTALSARCFVSQL
jgi:hypothetical protein